MQQTERQDYSFRADAQCEANEMAPMKLYATRRTGFSLSGFAARVATVEKLEALSF